MKAKHKTIGTRRQARELALQLLYAIDATQYSLEETTNTYDMLALPAKPPITDFTTALLRVVLENLPDIDKSLQSVIKNWKLERLSVIDLNLLRLAAAEIFYFDDIPPKVSINEYIEIAKEFGDNDSPSFVNGILDRIAHESAKGGEIK